MEKENQKTEEYVKKIVSPIFQKALQEHTNNQQLVGSGKNPEKSDDLFYLWQPHNFRRYFSFKHDDFIPKKSKNQRRVKTNVGLNAGDTIIFSPFSTDYLYKNQNYGSEHHYFKFNGCTIKVRKNTVEVTVTEVKDKWFKISANSIKDIDTRIDQISGELEEHCKNTLRQFINIHGGRSDFKIIKRHSENKIKGDDFIKKIPVNMVIHDTVMKKVYKESNVELYGEAAVKNHFKNTTFSYVAPEIAKEMSEVKQALEHTADSLKMMGKIQENFVNNTKGIMVGLEEQIKSHLALIQEYRIEAQERNKPFFVRWYKWLKGLGKN